MYVLPEAKYLSNFYNVYVFFVFFWMDIVLRNSFPVTSTIK